MADRLPPRLREVREEDASPEVRALYDDIRRATGTPGVNLILRHLALEPAVLDWCWRTIGPAYRDGRIAAAAARMHDGLSVPRHPPVWQAAGADEAEAIRAVLAFYDRGNSSNLIGLTTLLRVARSPAGAARAAAASAEPPTGSDRVPAPAPVPSLPRQDAIPPEIMALITDLADRQGTAEFGVLPSLWLHLSLWPRAMRRAHETIVPILASPEWPRSVEALLATAGALADELAETLEAPSPAPPDGMLQGYLDTVDRFVRTPIPQMVLVGRILSGGEDPARPRA